MIVVDHGIAQRVVLVAILQRRLFQHGALFHAKTFGEGTCRDVAHDHFQRHDGHFFHDGFAIRNLFDQMGRHAFFFQHLHQMVGHAVVDHAFARDGALFLAVKRGRVVLVIHDIAFGIVGFVHLFGFAFVQLFELLHNIRLLYMFILF